ncbi:hypothetical protein GCM10011289_03970 [Paludibacterium paludis]|uniref:Flagellar hook-length control protein-like C-terminal domain-containing protein n=2 Tax=Paludibacterium paludis TaxID=1225769 RepID=A0A918NYM2_9NEIS|nr:hypothetical protein GCM10011289_03970 [Paludibacterium paludis]
MPTMPSGGQDVTGRDATPPLAADPSQPGEPAAADSAALPFAQIMAQVPPAVVPPVLPDALAGQTAPGVPEDGAGKTADAGDSADEKPGETPRTDPSATPWLAVMAMQVPVAPLPQTPAANDRGAPSAVAPAAPAVSGDASEMPATAPQALSVAVQIPSFAAKDAPTPAKDTTGLPDMPAAVPAALAGSVGAAPRQNAAQPAEWAPVALPAATPARWGHALMSTLGERVTLQADHAIQNAVIRLDPPMLGSLEIAIRHEAGSLVVQLTASNGDVARQLQTVSDTLRNDLMNRQFTDVAVSVAHQGAGDGRGSGRQSRDEASAPPPAAASEIAQAGDERGDRAYLVRV